VPATGGRIDDPVDGAGEVHVAGRDPTGVVGREPDGTFQYTLVSSG